MAGTIYLSVGIPACGKSTQAEKMLSAGTVDVVVSSDAIRQELTGDATDQSQNEKVFATVRSRIRAALVLDWSVFIDATNLRPEYRKDFADIADEFGAAKIALLFADSDNLDLCSERNNRRTRYVPQEVMERFHKTFLSKCRPEQLIQEGWKVVSA